MLSALWPFILTTLPWRVIEAPDATIMCYEYEGSAYVLKIAATARDSLLNGEAVTITPLYNDDPACRKTPDYVCHDCHAFITR